MTNWSASFFQAYLPTATPIDDIRLPVLDNVRLGIRAYRISCPALNASQFRTAEHRRGPGRVARVPSKTETASSLRTARQMLREILTARYPTLIQQNYVAGDNGHNFSR